MLRVGAALLLSLHCSDAWIIPAHPSSAVRLDRPVLLSRYARGSSSVLRLRAVQSGQQEASVQKASSLFNGLLEDPTATLSQAAKIVDFKAVGVDTAKLQQQLQTTASQVVKSVSALSASEQGAIAAVAMISLLGVVLFRAGTSGGDPNDSPYPEKRYDAKTAAEYFQRNPALYYSRALEILGSAAGFGFALLLDLATGSIKENEATRADELASLLSR